ncbi:hypothetical protein HY478_01145 [Candidatus Uhrbacteria bacterium]|nr:hypothetical protein [Candidatus Uhrbacteria bacterium]
MKTFVTHIRPHLDDICGIWLYQKYVPSWKKAVLRFIPTSPTGGTPYGGKPVDSDPHIIHVGVCRGKYDEHKGNTHDSAASLVWKDLRRRKLTPRDADAAEALARLVHHVLEGDLGKRGGKPDRIYEIGRVIMGVPNSLERTRATFVMLDGLLNLLTDRVKLDRDWRKKKVFETRWGRGVGLTSKIKATDRAYEEGYVLVAQVDPIRHYRSIRAYGLSRVDLSRAYRRARALEPQAEWYFHHSKRMLICGSDVASLRHPSKLTLGQLIALVKK